MLAGQLGLTRPHSAGHLMALLPLTERQGSPTHASHGNHTRAITRSRAACLLLLAAALLFVGSFTFRQHSGLQPGGGSWGSSAAQSNGRRPVDTLVICVFSDSDPEYLRNLEFFVEFGMAEGDGCEYVIVVQQDEEGQHTLATLPRLPPNARYEFHRNECFDWGTIGWLLETELVDTRKYKWFMFLNSSTRGPFLPAYWPRSVHWSRAFTGRITAEVKLVGATISCESTLRDGDAAKGSRQMAHVQSYAMATDQAGLAVLQADGRVFECHDTIHNTVWHSEVGASSAMLQAGYNLDSLMVRYQGIDWRDPAFWSCNARENPYKEASLDGSSLAPTEVLFVKVKGFLRELGWTSAVMAERHDAWLRHQGNSTAVTANRYLSQLPGLKKKGAFEMAAHGAECFDAAYYKQRNRDLPPMGPREHWDHFVMYGQFEGRPFRFSCGGEGTSPQQRGSSKEDKDAWAAASEVTPQEMRAVALKAALLFEAMVPHPQGLVGAVQELQQQQRDKEEQRHKAAVKRPKRTSKKSLQASEQPRRQAIERTHTASGKASGAQQLSAGAQPEAAAAAAHAEQATAVAPAVAAGAKAGTDMLGPQQREPVTAPGPLPSLQGGQAPLHKGGAVRQPEVVNIGTGGTAAGDVAKQSEGRSSSGSSANSGGASKVTADTGAAVDSGAEAASAAGPASDGSALHIGSSPQHGASAAALAEGKAPAAPAADPAKSADPSQQRGSERVQQSNATATVADQASGAEGVADAMPSDNSRQAPAATADPGPSVAQPAASTAAASPNSVPQQPTKAGSKRKPGSRGRKRRKPSTKVQRLPDVAPTLFGPDPRLRIVGGKVPDADA